MWFQGPFPGNMEDRDIFDLILSDKLLPGEGVEADSGYSGRKQIFLPGTAKTRAERLEKSQVWGRHKNMNGRLKIFGVMKQWNNAYPDKHGMHPRCVAIIVQLSFTLGKKLYDVPYTANYD